MRSLLFVVVGSVIVGGAAFAAVSLAGDGRRPEATGYDPSSPLLVAERPKLAVCVQSEGAVDLAVVKQTLERVQEEFSLLPKEEAGWMDDPQVDTGCATDPAIVDPANTMKSGGLYVKSASPYRLFVFVGRPYHDAGTPFRVSPAESLCHEHQCGEVTSALFLGSVEEEELRSALIRGLGLIALDPSLFPPGIIGGLPTREE